MLHDTFNDFSGVPCDDGVGRGGLKEFRVAAGVITFGGCSWSLEVEVNGSGPMPSQMKSPASNWLETTSRGTLQRTKYNFLVVTNSAISWLFWNRILANINPPKSNHGELKHAC